MSARRTRSQTRKRTIPIHLLGLGEAPILVEYSLCENLTAGDLVNRARRMRGLPEVANEPCYLVKRVSAEEARHPPPGFSVLEIEYQ